MNKINWTKVATVSTLAAGATGAILGNVLNDVQSDQVIAWADAGRGALIAAASTLAALVAAILANRKKA